MNTSGRLSLEGTLHDASAAVEALMAELARDVPPKDCEAIELGMAEIVSNIVRHGYDGAAGPIRIYWTVSPRQVALRICDYGKPMPKDSLQSARHTSLDFHETGLHDLPEGGLGLAFVSRMFHKLSYRSRGRVNRLVATRRMRPRKDADA